MPLSIRVTAGDAGGRTVEALSGTVEVTSTGMLAAGGGTTAAFVHGVLAAHSVTFALGGHGLTLTATRTGGTETGSSNAFDVTDALPEVAVESNGVDIADGDSTPSTADHTDVASTPRGTPVFRTFSVRNMGTAARVRGDPELPQGLGLPQGLSTSVAQAVLASSPSSWTRRRQAASAAMSA